MTKNMPYEKKGLNRCAKTIIANTITVMKNMTNPVKYTYGQKMIDYATDLSEAVYKTLDEKNFEKKLIYGDSINLKIHTILQSYRVCKDLLEIDNKVYENTVQQIFFMKGQLDNWMKYIIEQINLGYKRIDERKETIKEDSI